jgi:hypothetical protein
MTKYKCNGVGKGSLCDQCHCAESHTKVIADIREDGSKIHCTQWAPCWTPEGVEIKVRCVKVKP